MYINTDIDYVNYLKDKEVMIWGAGIWGARIGSALERENIKIRGYIDSKKCGQKMWNRYDVISFEEFLKTDYCSCMIIIALVEGKSDIKLELYEKGISNFIDFEQIDILRGDNDYYDDVYFDTQMIAGEFAARFRKIELEKYIKDTDTVIDFGCGGGFMLNQISAKMKYGIEINKVARLYAQERYGIECVANMDELPDEIADVIISSDVLEHVVSPYEILVGLRKKLKPYGKIVFSVPCESSYAEYHTNDFDNHLYTWNALNLGNLFKTAGYFVRKIKLIGDMAPEDYIRFLDEAGEETFKEITKINGKIYNKNKLIIVAEKGRI